MSEEPIDYMETLLRLHLEDIIKFYTKHGKDATFDAIVAGAFNVAGEKSIVEIITDRMHDYVDTYPKWIINAFIHIPQSLQI